jgi:hypothetical protein
MDFWIDDAKNNVITLICDELQSLAEEELDSLKRLDIISHWSLDEVNDGQLFYDVVFVAKPSSESELESETEYSICSLGENKISFNDYKSGEKFIKDIDESPEWKNFYKYCNGYSEVFYSGPRSVDKVKSLVAEVSKTLLDRRMKKLAAAQQMAHKMFGLEFSN